MLVKRFGLLVFLFGQSVVLTSDIIKDSELVLALLVHRHGDRTPESADYSFSNHPEELAKIVDKYGLGELTPRGKYRGYQIGQFIRARYSFLSPQYNESELYLRSTDVTRTKMTALTSMAAVYPAGKDNWSDDINWTPVPYTTVPACMDFNTALVSCPKYIVDMETYKPRLDSYQDVLKTWSNITGKDFSNPYKVYTTYDQYYCQKNLGIPLDSSIERILPDIEKAAAAALQAIFGNEEFLPLLTGVLLEEFVTSTSNLIKGYIGPRVRIYSAHDINVYSMVAASKIEVHARPGVPKYGSIFGLEARRLKTGQYVVLPIYVANPSTKEVLYLPVQGCGSPCNYESFRKITKQFALNEYTWKQKCKVNYVSSSSSSFVSAY